MPATTIHVDVMKKCAFQLILFHAYSGFSHNLFRMYDWDQTSSQVENNHSSSSLKKKGQLFTWVLFTKKSKKKEWEECYKGQYYTNLKWYFKKK